MASINQVAPGMAPGGTVHRRRVRAQPYPGGPGTGRKPAPRCLPCQRDGIECDRYRPSCGACSEDNIDCQYNDIDVNGKRVFSWTDKPQRRSKIATRERGTADQSLERISEEESREDQSRMPIKAGSQSRAHEAGAEEDEYPLIFSWDEIGPPEQGGIATHEAGDASQSPTQSLDTGEGVRSAPTFASMHNLENDNDLLLFHAGSCCSACAVSKRWPQWVVCLAYPGCIIAAVSLYLLGWATSKGLDDEQEPYQCPSPVPRLGDAGCLFALQNCGWHISGLLAGLIPACVHAHRYRKRTLMKYAWLSAAACLGTIIASVIVYVRSPAKSQGLAGLSELPVAFFIFCATYEGLREEAGKRDENGFAM